MKVSVFLLFAFIGLACARESFWAQIAHEISDAFANQPIIERRVERRIIPGGDLDGFDLDDIDPDNFDFEEFDRKFKEAFPEGEGEGLLSGPKRTKQDGPTDLPLNKTDCRCRLNTKQRIVNGQEAVKNR